MTPLVVTDREDYEVPPLRRRFLDEEQCRALYRRIEGLSRGGGGINLHVTSTWMANVRWARNMIVSGGEIEDTSLNLSRTIKGASGWVRTNELDDAALEVNLRRAEQHILLSSQNPEEYPVAFPDTPSVMNPLLPTTIWFDATYGLAPEAYAEVAHVASQAAQRAGVAAAGYIEIKATGVSVLGSLSLARYAPFTGAQCSITMRDALRGGSGWAGVDFNDWRRIDTEQLIRTALDKCERSRDPALVEPGRYTAVLEPQAVCDLVAPLLERAMERTMPEEYMAGPFVRDDNTPNSKIGEKVVDERITISADPSDPDCGFVPFDRFGEPFRKVDWIANGVLRELSYSRNYGLQRLGTDWALPNSAAFRISGGTATVEEMIATTARGILVTRLNNVQLLDIKSMLLSGNTRDGLWLIEKGKITKAVKNFRFTESPLLVLNNIEQLGIPKRVFRPSAPAVCPPLKVRDFNFSGVMDAV